MHEVNSIVYKYYPELQIIEQQLTCEGPYDKKLIEVVRVLLQKMSDSEGCNLTPLETLAFIIKLRCVTAKAENV